jgi:hypothetical protein
LKALRCDETLGYYFSKPLPATELDAFVRQQNSMSPTKTAPLGKIFGNGECYQLISGRVFAASNSR